MTDDRPLLGVLLMVGFCALIPFGDAMAKLLTDDVPLLQIVTARFALQALLLMPFVLRRWSVIEHTPRLWRLMVWRTVLHIAGMGGMVTALSYLPLADAIAIAFVMPFILLLLGWWLLDEEVGPRRLIACMVGFCGTLMVVQPAFAEVGLPALLPMGVAVGFSFFILITRRISRDIDSLSLQGLSGLMALPILLAFWALPLGAEESRAFVAISGKTGVMLVLMGVVGTAAHFLMTLSLRYAPTATLAPMQYLEIPFATFIGWLFWRDLPNGLAAFGIMVTIAAGIYIVYREQLAARASASALAVEAGSP